MLVEELCLLGLKTAFCCPVQFTYPNAERSPTLSSEAVKIWRVGGTLRRSSLDVRNLL
jgi:hypothetical protein